MILVPTVLLAKSSIAALQDLAASLKTGSIVVSPPDSSVTDWPLIGDQVYEIRSGLASNLEATLNAFAPQLQAVGG